MDNPLVILLVEDEVLVRMVAADVLEDAGFTVLESTNAEEALRLLETRPDVQVLFTDVNMPGALDGLGLAQTVHERSPEVGILIGSGRIRPDPGELPPGTRFIAKPYAPRCPHRRRTCGGTRTAGEGATRHARSLTGEPSLRRKRPTASRPTPEIKDQSIERRWTSTASLACPGLC